MSTDLYVGPSVVPGDPSGEARSPSAVDLRSPRTTGDRLFRLVLFSCASTVLVIIAVILIFLALKAWPAWRYEGIRLVTTAVWSNPQRAFGFGGDLVGSFVIAGVALVVAAPIALATALAINEYVPRVLRKPLTALVDLLAAVPSLVYGLWGGLWFQNHVYLTAGWLGHNADFFPLFRLAPRSNTNGSEFLAGLVVAIMVLPLMTSVSREVMSQVPREDCEAALALGGTRWGMITDVVLPFGRNGIVGGAMLAFGRALGETIAVSLILSANDHLTSHILQAGGGSVAATIATQFSSTSNLGRSALTFAGLLLFAMTLGVNIGARFVVSRSSTGSRR
jgi:phosphate transport system permease protein